VGIPQGDVRLLQSELAQRLLSTELARRGRASVTDVDGIVPEYVRAHYRYAGPEQGARNIAEVDRPGTRMARIAVRPTWVGVLDFTTRFPGGTTAEQFAERGR
jgi:hypothetical protein